MTIHSFPRENMRKPAIGELDSITAIAGMGEGEGSA